MTTRTERLADTEESFRSAVEGMLAGVWTALPGIIQSVDLAKMTVEVQPAIQAKIRNQTGDFKFVTLPLLVDVPLMFPKGGGFHLTFPVAAGDECLVIFADRCIDNWWQSGTVQPPAEARFHDLSDGFAFVGIYSQPKVIDNVSTTAAQLRNDDGTVFVEVRDDFAKVSAPNVKVHAGISYAWDCHGYGEKLTWTGGTTWQRDTYYTGATVTTVPHAINPPETPE